MTAGSAPVENPPVGAATPSGVKPIGSGGWWWRFWNGAGREHLRCEDCGAALILVGLRSGTRARCGQCGSVFRVPGAAVAEQDPLEDAMQTAPTVLRMEGHSDGSDRLGPVTRPQVDVPREIGPYQLDGEIARGGTAIVYRGRHATLGKSVAVKLLLPHLDSGPEMERRLFREALALARFRHPHIVPVLDAGSTPDGLPYLVMERVDGEDLGRRLARDGPMAWQAALEILIQVAEAVDFAHAHGVIHRDLKPANVLLDRQGRAQLVDFGLARDEGSGSRLTASGMALGTPAYMPPEQARGEREQVGRRADLYSLGAILYEMLSGRPPFQGDTVMEVLYRVVHEHPEPLRRLQPGLPADVEAVCMKLLEKDPRNRYASAYQLLQDLHACLAGDVPVVARPGRTPAVLRFLRRSGWRAALIAVALLGGLAYLTAYRAASRRADELIGRGQELLHRGQYAEAEALFSEAQNLRPKSAPAFIGRQEARRRLRESEETQQAQAQQKQEALLREFRQVLGALSTEQLQSSVKEGTDKLVDLVAQMMQSEGSALPGGAVPWALDAREAGMTVRIMPVVGDTPVFEGPLPALVPLTPGLYRLAPLHADGTPARECLLNVKPGSPQRMTVE